MDGAYNVTHRAFLQHLLSHQTTTFEEAQPVLAKIQTLHQPDRPVLEQDVTVEDFEHYVETINSAISPLDLEIRRAKDQQTKVDIYALVNVQSDALTQMATVHSADEIGFVKRMLDAMFVTNNTRRAETMAVTSMQAIKLHKAPDEQTQPAQNGAGVGKVASITQTQAEAVLTSLVEEGWLKRNTDGYYYLSPRALMELRSWLVETYNDREDASDEEREDDAEAANAHQKIKLCEACREIVTIGKRCPKLECEARLHKYCVRNIFRAQGGREECPKCHSAWVDAPPVGPKAARGSRASGANARRSTQNGRRQTSDRAEAEEGNSE